MNENEILFSITKIFFDIKETERLISQNENFNLSDIKDAINSPAWKYDILEQKISFYDLQTILKYDFKYRDYKLQGHELAGELLKYGTVHIQTLNEDFWNRVIYSTSYNEENDYIKIEFLPFVLVYIILMNGKNYRNLTKENIKI